MSTNRTKIDSQFAELKVERCPKCGSDERSMLCMECFRNEQDPHPWHHSFLGGLIEQSRLEGAR